MKNLLFFLFFAPVVALASQNINPGLDAITAALKGGDVETLSKYFGDKVEISIGDKEEVYEKAKATEVLRNFFASSKPTDFNPIHKGQSRENSDQYCIGKLNAGSGNYRVFFYYKMNGNNALIQEIRFEKE